MFLFISADFAEICNSDFFSLFRISSLEIVDSLSSGTSSFSSFWLGLGSSIDGGCGVVTVTEFAKNEKKNVK